MKQIAAVLAGLLVAGAAVAGDVYVTKDAQGRPIYTDTPQTIPAKRVDVHVQGTDQSAAAQQRSSETKPDQASSNAQAQQPGAKQAAEDTAADRAKRCTDARQRYQSVMDARRLYEEGPSGERTYLTSEQIDQARANAKQVMDQFCADQ
jgi:hypothetical protein